VFFQNATEFFKTSNVQNCSLAGSLVVGLSLRRNEVKWPLDGLLFSCCCCPSSSSVRKERFLSELGDGGEEGGVGDEADGGRGGVEGGIELDAEEEEEGEDQGEAEVHGEGLGRGQGEVDEGVGDPPLAEGHDPREGDVPDAPEYGGADVGEDELLVRHEEVRVEHDDVGVVEPEGLGEEEDVPVEVGASLAQVLAAVGSKTKEVIALTRWAVEKHVSKRRAAGNSRNDHRPAARATPKYRVSRAQLWTVKVQSRRVPSKTIRRDRNFEPGMYRRSTRRGSARRSVKWRRFSPIHRQAPRTSHIVQPANRGSQT